MEWGLFSSSFRQGLNINKGITICRYNQFMQLWHYNQDNQDLNNFWCSSHYTKELWAQKSVDFFLSFFVILYHQVSSSLSLFLFFSLSSSFFYFFFFFSLFSSSFSLPFNCLHWELPCLSLVLIICTLIHLSFITSHRIKLLGIFILLGIISIRGSDVRNCAQL